MGVEYGRNLFPRGTGIPIQLSYDGKPEWKTGNLSIDWTTVTAVGADTLLTPEGLLIPNGTKFLRYGQTLVRITNPGTFTITVGGAPTSGVFPLTIYNPLTQGTTTVSVPSSSSLANTQTLMDGVFGAGNTIVSGAGALPGNVQTVTASANLLGWTLVIPTATIVGLIGGTPTVTIALSIVGTSFGKFGPYDFAATDGRASLSRSQCCLLNETILENGVLGYTSILNTNHAGGVIGGRVWRDRIIATIGTHSLAAGPTFAELEVALPRLSYAFNV